MIEFDWYFVVNNLPTAILRTFVAIVDHGGFTQAAHVLGLTQPTVSQQLKKLEVLVDTTLLKRGQRRMELTDAGQSLLNYARRILMLNDEAVSLLSKPSVSGRLRLGIPHEFTLSILPQLVGVFTQSHPNVVIEVECELSKHLLSSRKDYDVILALHERGVKALGTRLRIEPLAWVSSRDFQFAAGEPLKIIAAPAPCIYRANLERALRQFKPGWALRLTSTSYSAVCAAVSTGMGITVLAESVVPSELQILTPPQLNGLGKVDLRLHYDRSKASAATQSFAAFARERFRRASSLESR